ncbi:hypothetical protein OE88DRAFT_457135 [Heliocybe sulcata]|uniref:Uncharacterized protein n=1 Tax=Heliocybe sulcata TaxID=5364 RepID=A0A5C3MXZ2_9AGAM|nr:hypothetical protein OE88DRAFT_457135 [Heliocybe sulcata]
MHTFQTLDVILLSLVAAVTWYFYARGQKTKKEAKAVAAQEAEKVPDPDPLWDFDLATATTRNHLYVNKTVRWPYFQTMAHQPMHINDWIEIDKDYEWYLEEKARVIKEKGKVVIDSCPDNDAPCGELMEILVDYLPKRYPTLFEKIDCPGGGIWNKVTGEKLTGLEGKQGVDALMVCSRLVQDDFLMGREREDGQVYFTGGLVAFPGFYLLSKKINKSLRFAHAPVPYFNEKILMSVERTLKRFKPNESFERTSWEIVDDRNLHWHNMADLHSGEKLPAGFHPKDLFFRVDHQTFRKLPRTKGIIFGVHPIMKRLEDLEDSPLVPMLLSKVHAEGDSKLMKVNPFCLPFPALHIADHPCPFQYKAAPLYQDIMMPYLEELTARQIERGLITYVA